MAVKWKPLNVERIEEGRVMADLAAALLKAQRELVAYAELHGHRAKGAKAKVQLTLTLEVDNPDDKTVGITSDIKHSVPTRPTRFSTAIMDPDLEGGGFFVQCGGSAEGNPRQGRFTEEREEQESEA